MTYFRCIFIKTLLAISFVGGAPIVGGAQMPDTVVTSQNIIKLNLSTRFLYSSAYVVSYERVLKYNRSIGFTAGYVQFPKLFPTIAAFRVDKENSAYGFTVGGEYRYYLQKENRYAAPRGVYLGPYTNFYSFHNDQLVSKTSQVSSQASLITDIIFINVGFQIGYQFVINDRWTADMIFFGPSIAYYSFETKLKSSFTVDEQQELIQELVNRFPLLGDLIDGKTIASNGTTSKFGGGYRYALLVGYKFGKKKKK